MERPDDGGRRGGKDEGGGGTERERRVTLEVEDTHTHTHTHTHSSVEEQAATADRFITALKRVGIHFWLQQQQTRRGRRTSLFPGCSGCEDGVFSPSCGGYFVLSPLVQLSQHR